LAGSKRNSAVAALQVIFLTQQLDVGNPTIGSSTGLKLTLGTRSVGRLRVLSGRSDLMCNGRSRHDRTGCGTPALFFVAAFLGRT
jgi:hypothetical protein